MKMLREHLFNYGTFNHVAADAMAFRVKNHAKELGGLENDNLKAIFRFVNLSINYLASECMEEDFTLQGIFKLLFAEVYDEKFKEGKITVFDVLMEDVIKKDRALFNMYHYYEMVKEFVPDNIYDILFASFEKYCEEENVVFEKEKIEEVRSRWLIEHSNGIEVEDVSMVEDVDLTVKGIKLFNSFRYRFIEEDLMGAFDAIDGISNQRLREELKVMLNDFNDHKSVYLAIEELIK